MFCLLSVIIIDKRFPPPIDNIFEILEICVQCILSSPHEDTYYRDKCLFTLTIEMYSCDLWTLWLLYYKTGWRNPKTMSYNSEESESTPLLGGHRVSVQTRGQHCRKKMVQMQKLARKWIDSSCSKDAWKTRFPISQWITKYRYGIFILFYFIKSLFYFLFFICFK